jgi:hypothetical protein
MSEVRNIIEPSLRLMGGVTQLQMGYRYSGRQDEPESVLNGISQRLKSASGVILLRGEQ